MAGVSLPQCTILQRIREGDVSKLGRGVKRGRALCRGRTFNLPERDIVLGVANTLWDWGEADKAIPPLEQYLAKDCNHTLHTYLRCLISLGVEDKLKFSTQ
jgi:hypothetical protein